MLIHVGRHLPRAEVGRWQVALEWGDPPLVNGVERIIRKLEHGDIVEAGAKFLFVGPGMPVTALLLKRTFGQMGILPNRPILARELRIDMEYQNTNARPRWRGTRP